VDHHVRILILRRARAVAFRIGVRRNVEDVVLEHVGDVAVRIGGKIGIELGQHVTAVHQRPHLADRLVADAGHDTADILHHGVDGIDLVGPVLLLARRLVELRQTLVAVRVGQAIAVGLFVLHIVDAGAHIDDRLEGRMNRDVGNPLTVDPDFAAVPQTLAILVARTDHVVPSLL
jgi:hypothetical protein